jgi:hypothetical protein
MALAPSDSIDTLGWVSIPLFVANRMPTDVGNRFGCTNPTVVLSSPDLAVFATAQVREFAHFDRRREDTKQLQQRGTQFALLEEQDDA